MKTFMVIDDQETADVLAHVQRLQLLNILVDRAYSAEELVTLTTIPADELEYHLRVMSVYKLIEQNDDAQYRATARQFLLGDGLRDSTESSLQLALQVLDSVRDQMIRNPEAFLNPEVHQYRAEFGKGTLHLTPSEARELADELNALWERYSGHTPRPGTEIYSLLLLFFETRF